MSFSTDTPIPEIDKSPTAHLDYSRPWGSWLATDETITTADWEISLEDGSTPDPTPLVDAGHSIVGGKTPTIWLDGGTLEHVYLVACTITTNQGRVDSRTFRVKVVSR